jgi:glycosyltransferase involved in cell wall biosynthesis
MFRPTWLALWLHSDSEYRYNRSILLTAQGTSMSTVSVYIITYNEENKIAAAISSVIGWADEVIVADSYSTDNTVKIATELGATVHNVPFSGFGQLRNDAVALCQYPWIFSLDADERCTPEARDEILQIVRNNNIQGTTAYLVPRKNFLLGRWVKYSGWYPDYRQPQLFLQGTLHYHPDPVHEGYTATGKVGYLKHPIWQFPFENLSQMLHKANRYSTLGAEKMLGHKRGSFFKAWYHAVTVFVRNYIFRKGFLDGRAGFAIAIGNFIGTFYKYAKLTELEENWHEPEKLDV